MLTYGIILTIIYIISLCGYLYYCRTPESQKEFLQNISEKVDTKVKHYIKYSISAILNLSILGYLIYALTCI